MYELKDDYLTGIELIDKEHKKLFEIAEEAYQVLHNDYIADKYDNMVDILAQLKEYTIMHFEHEEQYMESIGYKKIFSQKVQHQEFIEKLEVVDLNEVDENPEEAIQDILTFLTDWLFNHILHMDKQIGK
ncbi:bacteriohemerythrin [Velocimicrobium porci]|uniref:Bacteriohemerythrin n=1 Tax=Velocimicrobium porci TaxID=2606634 RepID=A0A6L5XXS9_9FIRM|nr:hemerythrin family protein [Velocimicrobium porci]MSS63444.1 bacteriohemerythrin [Velocimicrobium porci]